MEEKKTKLQIRYTVYPDEGISEQDWMEHVKAGRLCNKPEQLERARDMMRQYNEGGSINPLYKKIIDNMKR